MTVRIKQQARSEPGAGLLAGLLNNAHTRANLAYESLDKRQLQLLKTRYIKARRTPRKWIKFLRPIAEFEREGARAARLYRWVMLSAWGLAGPIFVTGILGFQKSQNIPTVLATLEIVSQLIAPTLLATALGALGLRMWFLYRAMDALLRFSGILTELLIPLARSFVDELAPGVKLYYTLDLRGRTIDEAENNRSRGERVSNYRYDWFRGKTTLARGTPEEALLKFEITDKIREIHKGGRKKKPLFFKCKLKRFIDVRLRRPDNSTREANRRLKYKYMRYERGDADANLRYGVDAGVLRELIGEASAER